ncbi:MAG TPA: DUF1501 domain-containing protein [Allosphingosinicella sp.]|nr:DUF1501 domain-containing protein [Allosphingosinicella sp.]
MVDRRIFLAQSTAAFLLLAAPHIAIAQAATDRRFVFVIQRGAADGLGTLAPTGDPAFAALRGAFAEDFAGGARIGDYMLHPALTQVAGLAASREALFVHAIASPYRDRSHFDGQNVLETGGTAAYALSDGWMNRLLGLLGGAEARAIAVSATVPMVLRGARDIASYAPSALPDASDDLLARVTALYESDQALHAAWAQAMQTRAAAGDLSGEGGRNGAATGALAARLLAGAEGARIAVIETGGWDTHANQRGRLAFQLRGLDALLGALKAGLGADWARTLVLVATEFGRTAAPNGTGGTDHGTAGLAMLLGGAVAGGRVVADWPGLGAAALHEGRDLRPTLGLDTLIASALAQHYRLDLPPTARTLFPNMASARMLDGLIRV